MRKSELIQTMSTKGHASSRRRWRIRCNRDGSAAGVLHDPVSVTMCGKKDDVSATAANRVHPLASWYPIRPDQALYGA